MVHKWYIRLKLLPLILFFRPFHIHLSLYFTISKSVAYGDEVWCNISSLCKYWVSAFLLFSFFCASTPPFVLCPLAVTWLIPFRVCCMLHYSDFFTLTNGALKNQKFISGCWGHCAPITWQMSAVWCVTTEEKSKTCMSLFSKAYGD